MSCGICLSKDLQSINVDMLGGLSLRAIGRKYELSASSLSRHRGHIPTAQIEDAIVLPPSTGSLTDQLKALIEDTRRVARKAEESGHLQSAVAALKTINGHLELLAKLSGELATGTQVAVGVNVNIRGAWENCDPAVMRWALARHVREMIKFEPATIENLQLLSAGPCPECKRYGCAHDLL